MKVERVPAAGHFLPQERPDLVARRLIEGFRAGDPGLGSEPVSSPTR
jgi:hypothetical protein